MSNYKITLSPFKFPTETYPPSDVIHCRCNFTQNLTVYALISAFGIYDFRIREAIPATRTLPRKFK